MNTDTNNTPLIIKALCGFVFVYLSVSYFYVFPSGNPQPGDLIIVIGIALSSLLFLVKGTMHINKAAFWALSFGAYTFLINILYYLQLQDFGLVKASLYYGYNAALFTFLIGLFMRHPEMMKRVVYAGIIASLIGQMIVITFLPEYETGRLIGSFNNPNQLSQWALFTACMIITLKFKDRLNVLDLGLIALTVYIQTLALSKAGIICTALLLLSLPFSKVLRLSHKIIFVLIGLLIIVYGVFEYETLSSRLLGVDEIQKTVSRIGNIGKEADDSPRGRGYYRLIEYPEYLITGAGEGAYRRFADFSKPIEIHSGVLSILFSYGIIGFGIFAGFAFMVFRRAPVYMWFLLFIILLNGLTHQNIRFSHFWIFMAVVYGMQHFLPPNSPPESSKS